MKVERSGDNDQLGKKNSDYFVDGDGVHSKLEKIPDKRESAGQLKSSDYPDYE